MILWTMMWSFCVGRRQGRVVIVDRRVFKEYSSSQPPLHPKNNNFQTWFWVANYSKLDSLNLWRKSWSKVHGSNVPLKSQKTQWRNKTAYHNRQNLKWWMLNAFKLRLLIPLLRHIDWVLTKISVYRRLSLNQQPTQGILKVIQNVTNSPWSGSNGEAILLLKNSWLWA